MIKKYPNIDYNFRPTSYWDEKTVEQAILKNIKGEFRRKAIREALNNEKIEGIPEEFLEETLSKNIREATGRIHPHLMGGEYLPNYEAGEIEIARISLESTTNDIISLRAQRTKEGDIHYKIVDEYNSDFSLSCKASKNPLTLLELATLLENSYQIDVPINLIVGFNEMNYYYTDIETLKNFTSVNSEFYPQLYNHCEKVIEGWVKEKQEEEKEGEGEGEVA
jgi:hypothetical protein